jgi:hypothetical protein
MRKGAAIMSITIKTVSTSKDIKDFVKFQFTLYKNNPYFVPPIIPDEIETFSKKKNPAHKLSDTEMFLAYRDGKIVGRIVAIVNKPANKKYNTKNMRFSWIEFVEDYEVAKALLDAAREWGRKQGMETMTGPHGYCDLDPQGMLVEGFDKEATIASFYHHPYYHKFLEQYGLAKEVDYVEFLSTPPYENGIPEKMLKTAEWIQNRYNYRILDYKSAKEYKKRGKEIFALLEESFDALYGTVPLSEEQVNYYINKYISFIHPELIKVVVNASDEMIGFMITMPSLSKAYKKSNGNMIPFGMINMLKALKTYDIIDFYLAGVKNEYRNKGVDLMMVVEIVKSAMKLGFKYAESNQELEHNTKVQAEWKFFNPVMHKRRRIYKMEL